MKFSFAVAACQEFSAPVGVQALGGAHLPDSLHFATFPSTYSHWELFAQGSSRPTSPSQKLRRMSGVAPR
jgi:hypothetical protein